MLIQDLNRTCEESDISILEKGFEVPVPPNVKDLEFVIKEN